MKKSIFALLFIVLSSMLGFSQDYNVYYARNVRLELHGVYKGLPLLAKTETVGVRLDYETAELRLNFELRSLKTNVDTLNRLLKNNFHKVVFDGKLGLEYINTQSHPPQYFDLEGMLVLDKTRNSITGTGQLHHVDDKGELTCMLGLTTILNLEKLGIQLALSGLTPDFEAVITQAVLRHDKG